MALECSAIGATSPKSSLLIEEDEALSNPPAEIELVPGNLKSKGSSDCLIIAELPANACLSITDLPPVLVSEIFRRLDAKDLGTVSCVSTLFNTLATEHQSWKEFYYDRWGPPSPAKAPSRSGLPNGKSWKELFSERESTSKALMGRYSIDMLRGHTEAVRAVFLLAQAKLVFTGGYDSVIRMWDMEDGSSVAVSHPLGCTVRAITADMELLVAGGTDAFLQCWKAVERHPFVFDISGNGVNSSSEFRLLGHEGPVTCLALDSARIFSGSWDMSVRVWDRSRLKCLCVLKHVDWVWSLVPRGSTVVSAAGRDVYIWDIGCGDLVKVIEDAHDGNAVSLARSYTGDLLFTGGEDGAIHMFEVMTQDVKRVATWVPHFGAVNSLAFEFPWLVSCSSDAALALIDVRKLLKSSRQSSCKNRNNADQSSATTVEAPQRMLHGSVPNLFSVHMGANRIVCGGDEGSVRVWNFSQALEIEKRAQAARRVRVENRMRRRRIQIEMSNKAGLNDQCSISAKRNQVNKDRNGIWHIKRGLIGKLKA